VRTRWRRGGRRRRRNVRALSLVEKILRQNVAEKTSGGGVGGEMDEDEEGGGGGDAGEGDAPKRKTAASVYQASWLTRGWMAAL